MNLDINPELHLNENKTLCFGIVVIVKNKKRVFSTISKYFLVDKGKFLDR